MLLLLACTHMHHIHVRTRNVNTPHHTQHMHARVVNACARRKFGKCSHCGQGEGHSVKKVVGASKKMECPTCAYSWVREPGQAEKTVCPKCQSKLTGPTHRKAS